MLVRDVQTLRNAFSYHPPYYNFGEELTNYFDLGPQNSRGFRALKVRMALRQVGRRGYVEMIGDDIRLSRHLFELIDAHPAFEALTQGLSIATFRYVPEDLRETREEPAVADYLDRLNHALLDRIQQSGEVFVSNAVVRGRYALRPCIVNFHTTLADIEALPAIIERMGREVDVPSRRKLEA